MPTTLAAIKIFFCAAGLTTLLIGLGLLTVPQLVTSIFLNQPIEENGLFFIRFAGTSLLGFTVLNFYAALRQPKLLRLAALVNLASLAPATVIALLTYPQNYLDKFNWLIVVEHTVFLVGFSACWLNLRNTEK